MKKPDFLLWVGEGVKSSGSAQTVSGPEAKLPHCRSASGNDGPSSVASSITAAEVLDSLGAIQIIRDTFSGLFRPPPPM